MAQPLSTLQDYLQDLLRTPKAAFNAALATIASRLSAVEQGLARQPGGRAVADVTVADVEWAVDASKGALQKVRLTNFTHTIRLPGEATDAATSDSFGASLALKVTPAVNCALVVGPGIKNLTPNATATPLQKDTAYLLRLTVIAGQGYLEVLN